MTMLLGIVLFFPALRFLSSLGLPPLWAIGGAAFFASLVPSLLEALVTAVVSAATAGPIPLLVAGLAALALAFGLWFGRDAIPGRDSFDRF